MQGTDPIPNLMGSDAGQGYNPFQGEPFTGLDDMGLGQSPSPISTGGYGPPGMTTGGGSPFSLTGEGNQGTPVTASLGADTRLNPNGSGGSGFNWEALAKIAAAFGPTAGGAAGLGLQAANRPK